MACRSLILAVGLSMGTLSASGPAEAPAETGKVVQVIDGDTIRTRMVGQEHTIHLIGVDTPETKHPTKAVEYFGREASDFRRANLQGKTVRLKKDRTGDTRDRYGRLLRSSSARAMHMPTGASPSPKEKSSSSLKNKHESKEKACGAAKSGLTTSACRALPRAVAAG